MTDKHGHENENVKTFQEFLLQSIIKGRSNYKWMEMHNNQSHSLLPLPTATFTIDSTTLSFRNLHLLSPLSSPLWWHVERTTRVTCRLSRPVTWLADAGSEEWLTGVGNQWACHRWLVTASRYTECAGETLLRGSLCGEYLLSMSNDKQWSFSDSSDIDHWIWKKVIVLFLQF